MDNLKQTSISIPDQGDQNDGPAEDVIGNSRNNRNVEIPKTEVVKTQQIEMEINSKNECETTNTPNRDMIEIHQAINDVKEFSTFGKG